MHLSGIAFDLSPQSNQIALSGYCSNMIDLYKNICEEKKI